MKLRLLSLYPDQMNIYADRGNILFLQQRCQWRGIGFEVTRCGPREDFDPAAHDLIYMGGGQDRDQKAVARDLVASKREAMVSARDDGAAILAVCGGYQLLGESYQLDEEVIEGLGLVDLKTVREPGPRLTGPASISVELDGTVRTVAGFENHGGRTWLGPEATPLGKVIDGHGNNGKDGFEGVRQGNLIGTYLHGPLLPKNSWLADYLIRTGLEHQHGGSIELEPLDDSLEDAAHRSALAAARAG
ncbi:MAG: glutamine amidotransferase [Actinomycetota bacterium]|nr:glutamine amidotransferase [Actinomycetota bacterium]